jgi:hypothetical protein
MQGRAEPFEQSLPGQTSKRGMLPAKILQILQYLFGKRVNDIGWNPGCCTERGDNPMVGTTLWYVTPG